MMKRLKSREGFTLLEILIVIALIAILIGIVIAVLNPARQFANARNSTRWAHLNTMQNGISTNMSENTGSFSCATVPAAATNISSSAGDYDIGPCLVPDYISAIPFDPSAAGAQWTDETNYNSGYSIFLDANGRIVIEAPSAELEQVISQTR